MIKIKKGFDKNKVAISAKIEEANKKFINLLQDALNDLFNELNYNNLLNFTETLELIIETFSKDNPYVVCLDETDNYQNYFMQISTKKYTIKEVVDKYIEKYAVEEIRKLFEQSKINNTVLINILDDIMYKVLVEFISYLNDDLHKAYEELDQEDIDEINLEIRYEKDEEIREDLSGAYCYLQEAIDSDFTTFAESYSFTICEMSEIEDEFRTRVLEYLNINNIFEYCEFNENKEIIKNNLILIFKLLKLYLFKIENKNSYTLLDKPVYNNELESFLEGKYDIKISMGHNNVRVDPLNYNI